MPKAPISARTTLSTACLIFATLGKAKLKGDAESTPQKELVASTSAVREALSFLKGFKVKSSTVVTQVTRRVTAEETALCHEAGESIERVSSEKLLGQMRTTRPVGTWLSMDGQYYFQAHVIPFGSDEMAP